MNTWQAETCLTYDWGCDSEEMQYFHIAGSRWKRNQVNNNPDSAVDNNILFYY